MKPIEIKKQLIKKLNKIIKLKFKYYGPKNNYIKYFTTTKKNISHSIAFSENDKISNASKIKSIIILKKKNQLLKSQIITKKPRLFYVKLLEHFKKDEISLLHYPKKNYLSYRTLEFKKKNIFCDKNVFIGNNVKIGKKTYIGKNVVIYPYSNIGKNVKILDNSVIGCYGLGYIDQSKLMPHMGKVIINNDVTIGSNCTVVRGTLQNTIVGQRTVLANNINIGHNVIIGKNTKIASSSSISGGTIIRGSCQIGIGTKIKNNLIIGKNTKIGIGSVVAKNLKKNSSVFGNPARYIKFNKKVL